MRRASRGVRRGRLRQPAGPLPAAPWGVPVLLACCGGVTRRARPASGAPLSATGSGGRVGQSGSVGDSGRANLVNCASGASLTSQRSGEAGVKRAQPFGARVWAGVRPRKNRRPVQGGEPCRGPGREPWPPEAGAASPAPAGPAAVRLRCPAERAEVGGHFVKPRMLADGAGKAIHAGIDSAEAKTVAGGVGVQVG